MSEDQEREKTNSFEDLAPRVIIFDIFPFFKAELIFYKKEFDLFGYFRKDYSRHIWFLFSSVEIGIKKVIVDFPRLNYLSVVEDSTRIINLLDKAGSEMRSLKTMDLFFERRNPKKIETFFTNPSLFPALVDLCLYAVEEERVDLSSWKNSPDLWRRLNKIEIQLNGFANEGLFKLPFFLTNITELEFQYVFFEKEMSLGLPNLKEVDMIECKNLLITPGDQLEVVKMNDIEPKMIKSIVENSNDLVTLKITHTNLYSKFSELSFLREVIPRVKESLNIDNISGFEGPIRFSRTMEDIEIDSCFDFDSTIFLQDIPSLKRLCLMDIMVVGDTPWSFCRNLKYLEIDGIDNIPFFFQVNQWDCLEELSIVNMAVCGEVWSPMPKLKSLEISDLGEEVAFFEEIFPVDGFPRLENLEIDNSERGLGLIHPKESNNFFNRIGQTNNLKSLKLQESSNHTNESFKTLHWENLEFFFVSGIPLLTGEDWTYNMPKLKTLELYFLPNFTDAFFQSTDKSFPNIEYIHFDTIIRLTGKNWTFFSSSDPQRNAKLNWIELRKVDNFTDAMFIDFEFPNLKRISIEKCKKLTGLQWNPLRNLQNLVLKNGEFGVFETDRFIKEHADEFSESLVKLNILNDSRFTGTGFNGIVFKKLEKIDVEDCIHMRDEVFQQQGGNEVFPALRDLDINACPLVKVRDWSFKPSMRRFRITGGDVREDSFNPDKIFPRDCRITIN